MSTRSKQTKKSKFSCTVRYKNWCVNKCREVWSHETKLGLEHVLLTRVTELDRAGAKKVRLQYYEE